MATIPRDLAAPSALAAEEDRELKRDIGRVALLFAGVGSIIGSGWLFGALYAAQQAGPGSLVSWALGGVMIMFIALVYAELGTMFPVSGGVVRFPHYAFGSLASYTVGWITWLAAVTVAPIEVEAAIQYAHRYIPSLTTTSDGVTVLTGPGYGVAVALMLLFSLVNVVGVRFFARANTGIVVWKLAIISLVVAALLVVGFHGSHLSAFGGFAPYGGHGIFSSIATAGIVFSYLGFRQGVELAGETRNPQRNVPLAVIGSVAICAVIYILLELAFVGAAPAKGLAHGWTHLSFANETGPLAGIATLLGLGWLAVLLYIDAIVSPADTGLIYTTVTARISYAMGRNRNAPETLSRVSARGVPWVSVAVTFVAGMIFLLPFPGWQKLVGFITSATVLSFGSGALVVGAMRRQLPDAERPFRLPGGDVVPLLAFYCSNMIVYWAGWETDWKLFAAIGIGFVLLVAHSLVRRDQAPALEWRAASWALPWLGGLIVISALGSYGGGAGLISFGWAWGIVAVFSVLVYAMAVAVRLPRERVLANLGGAPEAAPPVTRAAAP